MRATTHAAKRLTMAGLSLALAACWAANAHAAAEVHKFNVVLSAIPSSVTAGDFNDRIDEINRTELSARGLSGLDKITSAWLYQAEFRYFVRPNVAISAGAGQLRNQTEKEYLPALQQNVQLRLEMLSVPIHLGAAYYFTPYNQGDFQARAYVGGGLMSLVHNRVRFQVNEATDEDHSIFGGSFLVNAGGDSPGYYAEFGVHMFFAARFSALVGVVARSAKVKDLEGVMIPVGGKPQSLGSIGDLDTSGVGARMGFAFGF